MFQIVLLCLSLIIDVYAFSFRDSTGAEVQLSTLRNKKILLVNIAATGPYANQLDALKLLQVQFADSITVVLFPSNSFGHEPRSNAEIRTAVNATGNFGGLLSEKLEVKGANIHPLFAWLANRESNGTIEGQVTNDFFKFLIDGQGNILGEFAPGIDPLDPIILDLIKGNQN